LGPKRKRKLVEQDLISLAANGPRRLDGEIARDRLGQKQLERALGVAPEIEPHDDLLLLRSGGAEPEPFDGIAGRHGGRPGRNVEDED
jgi:hypothetical protein